MKRLIVVLLAIMAISSAAHAEDIIIIANKDVPENTLTRDDIQEIFLGKTVQWSDHSKIYAATVKDEVHKMFLKEYLNRTETKWRAYWKRMVFTGRGVPPRTLGTEADLIAYVSETKGAVGYISSEGIQGGPETGIKIIKIK